MNNHPSYHPRVPRHFQVARVHRPWEAFEHHGEQLIVERPAPNWPCDYDNYDPVAWVASADLETIFRVTQLDADLDAEERALVRWGRDRRSMSVYDVVTLEYWESCPDEGFGLSVDAVYRCEPDGWSFLDYWPTLDLLDDVGDLVRVDARPRVELSAKA